MTNSDGHHEFFDLNVKDYERKHYSFGVRSFMTVRQWRVLEIVDALRLGAGAEVLDAGCGPGVLLEKLAERGFAISAVDASSEMLKRAKDRLRSNPDFLLGVVGVGDIEHLPFPNASFDLVCSTGVIEYLKDDANALEEMFRVLKPGGHLILTVTNRLSPVNYFDAAIEFLKRRDLFRKSFNLIWQKLGHGPLLPRRFKVRKHLPRTFVASLRSAGFTVIDDIYFHFLPWPRPFDRLLPKLSETLGRKMEKWGRSKLGFLGEGYLVLSKKTTPVGRG